MNLMKKFFVNIIRTTNISKAHIWSFLFIILSASTALADRPVPWQMGFQEAVTPVMQNIKEFHNILLVVIYAISIFVFILLVYTCYRFSAKRNPVPSKTTHNTLVEIIWTAVPVLILVILAVPSMRTLYFAEKIENSELTIKIVGNQWYWHYIYPESNLEFDSNMVKDSDIKPGEYRLLEVDNRVVVPVDTNVRVQLTAADVIHAWAMPAFGVKIDAVPGRLNETWFRAVKTGTYYGQCSELCGVGHGFMPIAVDVVSKEDFAKWLVTAKQKFK